ncbi:MAG: Nudix family hydrolase [Betaproteobacteria bacterium]|nr:Nudix family hydrolase [Betaproteobacteria bacterium]
MKNEAEAGAQAPLVRVAAAVLLRDSDPGIYGETREFLLARRPKGKVYAGWWEFPGGKLEAGESFDEALKRELDEELNIIVESATPWLNREFSYPHARVHLRFFRVTRWKSRNADRLSGKRELEAYEHDAIAWLDSATAFTTPAVSPILPANAPILKALSLPQSCGITAAAKRGVRAELERLKNGLAAGLKMIQVRDKTLPRQERQRFLHAVCEHARAHGALTLLNVEGEEDFQLARQAFGEDRLTGIHLSAAALQAAQERPEFPWVGASCHNAEEIEHAARLQLDFAVLGPVLPTPTHPGHPGIGWAAFSSLAEAAQIPVFALGGMRHELKESAQSHGAHGIALLRGW